MRLCGIQKLNILGFDMAHVIGEMQGVEVRPLFFIERPQDRVLTPRPLKLLEII